MQNMKLIKARYLYKSNIKTNKFDDKIRRNHQIQIFLIVHTNLIFVLCCCIIKHKVLLIVVVCLYNFTTSQGTLFNK